MLGNFKCSIFSPMIWSATWTRALVPQTGQRKWYGHMIIDLGDVTIDAEKKNIIYI